MIQWLSCHVPSVRGPGLIPGQGTRCSMLRPSSQATTKDPCATAETRHSQINLNQQTTKGGEEAKMDRAAGTNRKQTAGQES